MGSLLKRTLQAMEKLAPLKLADRSWDNVGLLVESPKPRSNATKIFLTIDLTNETLNEAIQDESVGVIIAYHPPIFKSLKRLTMDDVKQAIILNTVANGLSIYSPHTALDCCLDGVNDWIASGIPNHKSLLPIALAENPPLGQEGSGTGRIVTLNQPIHFDELVAMSKSHFNLQHVRIAQAKCHQTTEATIKTIAICAGSGASVLGSVDADVYLTGEMSHHELLAATADNRSVILCEHSNTERGYLQARLQPYLTTQLNLLSDTPKIEVIVSQTDMDPIKIV